MPYAPYLFLRSFYVLQISLPLESDKFRYLDAAYFARGGMFFVEESGRNFPLI